MLDFIREFKILKSMILNDKQNEQNLIILDLAKCIIPNI